MQISDAQCGHDLRLCRGIRAASGRGIVRRTDWRRAERLKIIFSGGGILAASAALLFIGGPGIVRVIELIQRLWIIAIVGLVSLAAVWIVTSILLRGMKSKT